MRRFSTPLASAGIDTPDFRALIKGAVREGTPPLEASPRTA
jgi:hypothetical protein